MGTILVDMQDCIFCKIANGKAPSHKVAENSEFMAFLDINPNTKGHSLVVPKKHYRWVWDVPNFGEYFEFAKKIGLASMKGLKADWVHFITVGKDVPHAHIHIIPRYPNDGHGVIINGDLHQKFSDDEMKKIAEAIKKEL